MSRVLPILFNTDMVRAILDRRKTVTRRLVKFLPGENPNWTGYVKDGLMLYNGRNEPCCRKSPYAVGDILYVRETWCNLNTLSCPCYYYKASDNLPEWAFGGWNPSIHMPKEAARIWLKVKDVRVEKLQDITNEQIIKEGISKDTVVHYLSQFPEKEAWERAAHLISFLELWNSTIKKKDSCLYDWEANPWVWVIEFEQCEKPE